jgi:hypothetical protein
MNIKLASMLTEYTIDVYRELDESATDEDIYLDEFKDEIDEWVINAIKGIGIDGEEQEEIIEAVELLEVDIFQQSPFRWVDLFDTSRVMVACGFEAWVSVVSPDGETWTALGKQRGKKMQKLAIGERVNAISVADDFLRMIEQDDAAKKTKRWLTLPISDKQLDHLTRVGYSSSQAMSLSRYSGVCALNFAWSRREIEGMILK